MKNQKGFTVIELLVIVSIFGVISSTILAATNSAKDEARTAKSLQFSSSVNHAAGANEALGLNFNNGVVGESAPVGTVIQDTTGQGNNGTIAGASAVYVDGPDNSPAILLDNGAYITGLGVPTTASTPMTIAVWISPVTNIDSTNIIGITGGGCVGGTTGVAMSVTSGKLGYVGQKASIGTTVSEDITGTTIPNNRWTFVTTSIDAQGVRKTYVNGDLIDISTDTTVNTCPPSSIWNVGGTSYSSVAETVFSNEGPGGDTGSGVNGQKAGSPTLRAKLDDIKIYNEALTAMNVKEVYALGLKNHSIVKN